METNKPLISFIVTVYNLENYISKCLDSILNQKFDNYEIIVVDNASTDNSYNICQKYTETYPNKIRFYQVPKEMAVMGTAHWIGFGVARGEYVQFIDGDDRLKENCLSEIADIIYLKKTDIIMGRFECYLEDGSINKNNFNDAVFEANKINNVSYDEALIYLSTLPNFQGVFWRYVFKRSLFEKNYKNVGDIFHYTFYSTLYSDGIMLIKLFLKANSIFFLDKTIYLYTRRANGSGIGFLGYSELSKDSVISLLNTLYLLISLKPINGRKIYLINKIYFIFKFFKFGLNYLEEYNQYIEISDILKDNIELLEAIKDCKNADLDMFYSYIKENGCLNGIVFYSEHIKNKFLDLLNNKNSKNLYIFPTGNKTISTLKLLKDSGYNVCAILDNDPQKNGHKYEGVPCLSPLILTKLDEIQKKSITIIVSTMDETLANILIRQLNELGINDRQIVIKE